MRKNGFTYLEMLLAIFIAGTILALSILEVKQLHSDNVSGSMLAESETMQTAVFRYELKEKTIPTSGLYTGGTNPEILLIIQSELAKSYQDPNMAVQIVSKLQLLDTSAISDTKTDLTFLVVPSITNIPGYKNELKGFIFTAKTYQLGNFLYNGPYSIRRP